MSNDKILVTTSTFPRWKNDTTPGFVYELTKGTAKRNTVDVLAPHHKGARRSEIISGIKVKRFRYFFPESLQKLCYGGGILPNLKKSLVAKMQLPFFIISQYFSTLSTLKKRKYNIVHAHWMLPQGIFAALFKDRFGYKLITTIHGSDVFVLRSKLFTKIQSYILKRSDAITVNSEATRAEVLKRFPSTKNKIHKLPMGIDLKKFKAKKTKKPQQFKNKKILLSVGRLSEQKGFQHSIKAISELRKEREDVVYLIIGEGPHKAELEKGIAEIKAEKYVRILGAKKQEELVDYFNFSDILLMPSISGKSGTEAQGLVILEAMACGLVCIGTKTGGIPELIQNGKNGSIIREKNTADLKMMIQELLNNKKKMEKFSKEAIKTSKNYSWEKISKKFDDLYKKP